MQVKIGESIKSLDTSERNKIAVEIRSLAIGVLFHQYIRDQSEYDIRATYNLDRDDYVTVCVYRHPRDTREDPIFFGTYEARHPEDVLVEVEEPQQAEGANPVDILNYTGAWPEGVRERRNTPIKDVKLRWKK